MNATETCPLTGVDATFELLPQNESYKIASPFGVYVMPKALVQALHLENRYPDQKHVFAAMIRQYLDRGMQLEIHGDNIEDLLDGIVKPATPLEQIDLIIQFIARTSSHGGQRLMFKPQVDFTIAMAQNVMELVWLMDTARELGYVDGAGYVDDYQAALTLKGWQRYEELRTQGKDSSQAFVAMSFNSALRTVWQNGIRPALKKTGWIPCRIDEAEHNERIDDQIIAEIRRSGLLIADLTYHRQNVYYEAGFAEGLGIPVIFTGREDEMEEGEVHFDIRQYKYITWTDSEQLERALINRIEATGLSRRL